MFFQGSVLYFMFESCFPVKTEVKKMWFLHAIVLICTGVQKKTQIQKNHVATSPVTEETSIFNQVPAASSKETVQLQGTLTYVWGVFPQRL